MFFKRKEKKEEPVQEEVVQDTGDVYKRQEQHKFLVSDRDQQDAPIQTPNGLVAKDYHMVDYEDIKRARSSSFRPFPAQNKYLTFDFQGYRTVDKQIDVYKRQSEGCTGTDEESWIL